MKIITLTIICLLLAGCTQPETRPELYDISNDISIYEDEEKGVTCYVLTSEMITGYNRSLSCLPTSQLKTDYEIK